MDGVEGWGRGVLGGGVGGTEPRLPYRPVLVSF